MEGPLAEFCMGTDARMETKSRRHLLAHERELDEASRRVLGLDVLQGRQRLQERLKRRTRRHARTRALRPLQELSRPLTPLSSSHSHCTRSAQYKGTPARVSRLYSAPRLSPAPRARAHLVADVAVRLPVLHEGQRLLEPARAR